MSEAAHLVGPPGADLSRWREEVTDAEHFRSRMRSLAGPAAGGATDRAGLSTFTIEDFLALEITGQGSPVVVAGKQQLGRRIRWLHVTELVNTQGLLQGGELILATGIALPQGAEDMARYVDSLADQGVAGLVIELGRRFSAVPASMVRACNRRRLPLIALQREVPFVKITEAAHSTILMGQRRLLHVTAVAHERFTELNSSDATVEALVAAAGELGDGEVVFSNLMHQVLATYAYDDAVEDLLGRWMRIAYTQPQTFGTQVHPVERAVVVPVEVRGQARGRLVMFTAGPPDPAQVMVLERAAAALAMRLLLESDDVVSANAQRTALVDIITGRGGAEAMHARTASLGHPTRNRRYLPVVVLSSHSDVGGLAARALEDQHLDALQARLAPERWGGLLLLRSERADAGEVFAVRLHELCRESGIDPPVVARGGVVGDLSGVRRSFDEANDVALASRAEHGTDRRRSLFSIEDVRLRGLLYTLRNDPRLQAFVERTLGPLLLRDAVEGGDWVRTLSVYLRLRGNKSLSAQELGISRPTLYQRLAKVQRLLQIDLEDPESSTSLFAAIMVVEATSPAPGRNSAGRRTGPARP